MTENFNTALIKLIPKKGDCTQIKNWRPISLLTCFYKVITRVVNSRLEKVIDKVTGLAQEAYNGKRYIHEAVINTVDAIRHCEYNGVAGVVLSIDQKKAFDSVFHGFAKEVYRFFGFGPEFINFMDTIGTKRTARILIGNVQWDKINMDRGFAQGNSPSPRMYNMVQMILIFKLEYDNRVLPVYNSVLVPRAEGDLEDDWPDVVKAEGRGLRVDKELLYNNRKVNAFADDTNCCLSRDLDTLLSTKNFLEDFGAISGLEANIEKTTLMPIGQRVPESYSPPNQKRF